MAFPSASPAKRRGFYPIKAPICFESVQQWAEWRAFAIAGNTKQHALAHCNDCSIEYQSRMIKEKRCANPGHIFAVGGSDE